MFIFAITICFSVIAYSNSEPTLILTPSEATVFVGDDVTFLCLKDDPSLPIAWLPVDLGSDVFRVNNKNVTKLITGVPDLSFNNTEIQCVGKSSEGQYYHSNVGKVIIQGILSEIDVNLFRKDVCTMQVSWVPPFTLPDAPILGYNVNITNLDNNITNSSVINNTSIDINLGYDYYVSIAAVNGAGEGNKSTNEINSTKLLNSIEGFNIIIDSLLRDKDKWKIDAIIDVTMICGNADATFVYKFCHDDYCFGTRNITRTDLSNSRALLSTLLFLPEDKHYDVQVEANVGRNVLPSSGTSLSTFDVQSVEETSLSACSDICLAIYYVRGSAATGCQMKLDCDSNFTFSSNVDGYNNQFHNFWCFPEFPLVGIKTCLLQVYDRIGQDNQNRSDPAVASTINVTEETATSGTPPTKSSTDSLSCSTKVTIAALVPISVMLLLVFVQTVLSAIIIVYYLQQKKGGLSYFTGRRNQARITPSSTMNHITNNTNEITSM